MNKTQAYKGYETWSMTVRMRIRMCLAIGLVFLAVHIAGTIGISVYRYPDKWQSIWHGLTPEILLYPNVMQTKMQFLATVARKSMGIFLSLSWLWLTYPLMIGWFSRWAKREMEKKHIRGAKLVPAKDVARKISNGDIPFGTTIRMPLQAETQHVFIVGRPGSGKTVAISHTIERLRKRRERGIIYDFKGDYIAKFYRPDQDLIFNPLDVRCLKWSVTNEIKGLPDVNAVATSLITPPSRHEDPFWANAARTVLTSILWHLCESGNKTNADIWEMVSATPETIASWLKNTEAGKASAKVLEGASPKTTTSVLSVLMEQAKGFQYLAKMDGDFSIESWIRDDRPGFIFVANYANVEDTLRPILSLFIDLVAKKLLSLPDDLSRRVYIVIDEFGTLQPLSAITNLLTLGRSKGASTWLATQDIGQVEKLYGNETRQTIVNACGTSLIFSVNDPTTAEFCSKKLGEAEVSEVEESYSMGPHEHRDGLSMMRRKKTERIVLPSEVQKLPPLTAYLKIQNHDVTKTQYKYRQYPNKNEAFQLNPVFSFIGGEEAIKINPRKENEQ